MKQLTFLDTGYFIALIRKKDIWHAAAIEAVNLYSGPFLTTDLVLVELANSLAKLPFRKTVVTVIEKFRQIPIPRSSLFHQRECPRLFLYLRAMETRHGAWSTVFRL